MSEAALALSLFFHIGATVVWIGGILLVTFLVVPEVNRTLADQPALYQLLRRLRKRFAPIGNLALALLIVTGILQMSTDPNYQGLLGFSNRWSQVLLFKTPPAHHHGAGRPDPANWRRPGIRASQPAAGARGGRCP